MLVLVDLTINYIVTNGYLQPLVNDVYCWFFRSQGQGQSRQEMKWYPRESYMKYIYLKKLEIIKYCLIQRETGKILSHEKNMIHVITVLLEIMIACNLRMKTKHDCQWKSQGQKHVERKAIIHVKNLNLCVEHAISRIFCSLQSTLQDIQENQFKFCQNQSIVFF